MNSRNKACSFDVINWLGMGELILQVILANVILLFIIILLVVSW